MIIWLASYPKSGNTWVRSFISALLYSDKGEFENFETLKKIGQFPSRSLFKNFVSDLQDVNEVYKNWLNVQNFINLDKKIKFFKTHHVNCTIDDYKFTNDENTIGAIHIVRDPRNVILSMKNHYSHVDYDETREFMFKDKKWIGVKKSSSELSAPDHRIPTLISSWNIHYKTWKNKTKNYLLVKYEDLQKNPLIEFTKIAKYVENLTQMQFDNKKIEKAIEATSFEKLENLEKKGLFSENAETQDGQKVKFFYKGAKNDWKESLSDEIIEKVNLKFKSEMEELGYL